MERSDVWFIAVVAAVMGLIAGLAWGDAGQASWLATYQTLIAGFMAVAAAYITVNAMARSDEQQRIRHAEQMEFAREPHLLVRKRAAENYPGFFADLANRASELGEFVASSDRQPEDIDVNAVHLVWRFVQFLRICVEDPSLAGARQYFQPITESNFHFLTIKNREFGEQDIKAYLEDMIKAAPLLDEEETERFFKLCSVISDMERPLIALSEDMERLA